MIEEKGTVWSDDDFDHLGWSMCRIYGLTLPGRYHKLTFHLDYILESPLTNASKDTWKIAPARLEFFNIINLKIDLKQSNYSETDFVSIERKNMRPTPIGKSTNWDFKIELAPDALIDFTSTGFTQTLLENPKMMQTYDLDRELDF